MNPHCEAEVRGIGALPAKVVSAAIRTPPRRGMKSAGFSLVEVMMAAVILVIGLTAAAVLAGTIMAQQELNAAALRAANVQEQAVKLYRVDLDGATIRSLLPETCVISGTPPANGYVLTFKRPVPTTIDVAGSAVNLDSTGCTMVGRNPDSVGSLVSNSVTILRPSTRVRYAQ